MKTTFIYALNDPETGECRYVGKADNPEVRFIHHFNSNETCHRTSWIKSLKARGLKPLLEILDEVPQDQWKLWERVWIKTSLEIGMDLTNLTGGGDGTYNLSQEVREKMSIDRSGDKNPMFGRHHTLDARKKIGRPSLYKGTKKSPEFIEMLRARKGEKRPAATCAKLRIKTTKSSSPFYGVNRVLGCNRWMARISAAGKRIYLGLFENEIEAAVAHDIAAKIHHGSFAHLNFPDK